MFSSKKIFKTRQEIKEALFRISSLDYEEKPKAFQALVEELDDGGVSAKEIKLVARELRQTRKISEIDKSNLLKLIKG